MIVLLAALGSGALLSLQPWSDDPVAPRLGLAPGLGAALDDARAIPPARRLAVAPARPATGDGARPVVDPAPVRAEAPAPSLAISPARPVARPAQPRPPAEVRRPPREPPPAPEPPAAAADPPAAVPVAVPAPPPAPEPAAGPPLDGGPVVGGHHGGPSTAGVDPGGAGVETVAVREGDERQLSFFFYALPAAFRPPGVENAIVRFRDADGDEPVFGLQLWDDGSEAGRGLWASGEAMGGERLLAPLGEGVWHELALWYRATSGGDGFYLLLLDGEPIDARAWIALIDPDGGDTWLELGIPGGGVLLGGISEGAIFDQSFVH